MVVVVAEEVAQVALVIGAEAVALEIAITVVIPVGL
jgi:hypothetical protein